MELKREISFSSVNKHNWANYRRKNLIWYFFTLPRWIIKIHKSLQNFTENISRQRAPREHPRLISHMKYWWKFLIVFIFCCVNNSPQSLWIFFFFWFYLGPHRGWLGIDLIERVWARDPVIYVPAILVSLCKVIFPWSSTSLNAGQPHPESYFVLELNSSCLHTMHTYIPFS